MRPSRPKRSRTVTFQDVQSQLSGLQKLIDECNADLNIYIRRKVSLDIGEIVDEGASSKEDALLAQQAKIEAKVVEINQLQRQKEDLETEIKRETAGALRVTRARTKQPATRRRRVQPKRTPALKYHPPRRITAEENKEMCLRAKYNLPSLFPT